MEVFVFGSQGTSDYRIFAIRTPGHFRVRLLPRGRPGEGGQLPRGVNAERRGHFMLLQVSYEGSAVDMAAN